MNEKEMIEEMAKDIPFLTLHREVFVGATNKREVGWMLSEEDNKVIAKSLISKGWIKRTEGSVVISKKEKQKLLKEMYEQGKFDALADLDKDGKVVLSKEEYEILINQNKGLKEENHILRLENNDLEAQVKKESKETVKEVLQELQKERNTIGLLMILEEHKLATKYGVEVEE